MNSKLIETIERSGLSEKEARVYLAALELGGAGVLDISKYAEVKRSNTYFILDDLMRRGLISSSYHGKKRIFLSVNPKRLIAEAQANSEILKNALPELLAVSKLDHSGPTVKFYEGKDGMGEILLDMIESMKKLPEDRREILEYASPEVGFEELEKSQEDFIASRIKNKIRLRWIAPDTELARKMKAEGKLALREMRLVLAEKFKLRTEVNIYGNKINFLGGKGQQVGVIIEHPEMAQTQREIFELAWRGSKGY